MSFSPSNDLKIRKICSQITTLTVPFNRFAPFGRQAPKLTFVAVGNRATAIHLSSNKILLLNPVPLTAAVKSELDSLGGVHYVACDLGHHMNVVDYVKTWPACTTIGVQGLEFKRPDVRWDFIYSTHSGNKRPEEIFAEDFGGEIETLMFEGFITRAVAWLHVPSRTLVVSDLLMSLPATEQYRPSSTSQGPGSWAFSQVANPDSFFFRSLIYYIATVDYALVRRDAKKVSEWDFERIVVCHGDVIEASGRAAWCKAYRWFIEGDGRTGIRRAVWDKWMSVMRRVGLGAW